MKKKEATYIVMKKRHGGKKPKGTKGPYKLVDKRMKKDKRATQKTEAKSKKPGKKAPTKNRKGKGKN